MNYNFIVNLKKSFCYTSEIHRGFSTARLPWSTMAPGLKVFQPQWPEISCINNVTEKFRWAYKHIHSTMYKHTHTTNLLHRILCTVIHVFICFKSKIILKFLTGTNILDFLGLICHFVFSKHQYQALTYTWKAGHPISKIVYPHWIAKYFLISVD